MKIKLSRKQSMVVELLREGASLRKELCYVGTSREQLLYRLRNNGSLIYIHERTVGVLLEYGLITEGYELTETGKTCRLYGQRSRRLIISEEIRQKVYEYWRMTGAIQKDIAKEFNLTESSISYILSEKLQEQKLKLDEARKAK